MLSISDSSSETSCSISKISRSQNSTIYLFYVSTYQEVSINKAFSMATGNFGTGIYFSTSFSKAKSIGRSDRFIIKCLVLVGDSVLLDSPSPNLTKEKLDAIDCRSVLIKFENQDSLIVIYNPALILEVGLLGNEDFKTKKISTATGGYYDLEHLNTKIGKYCKFRCINRLCKHTHKYHKPPCTEILVKPNWIKAKFSLYCEKPKCLNYKKIHRGKCFLLCINSKCQNYKSYHKKQCHKICENSKCFNNSRYHKGKCTITCKDSKCKNFLKLHKTKCLYICDNAKCKKFAKYHKERCIETFNRKGQTMKKFKCRKIYVGNIENSKFKENTMEKEEFRIYKTCKSQHIKACGLNNRYFELFDCKNIKYKKEADYMEGNIDDSKNKDCKRDFKINEMGSEDNQDRSFAKSIAKDDSDDERCCLSEKIEENNEISQFDNILCAVVITFAIYVLFPKAEKTAIINLAKMLL